MPTWVPIAIFGRAGLHTAAAHLFGHAPVEVELDGCLVRQCGRGDPPPRVSLLWTRTLTIRLSRIRHWNRVAAQMPGIVKGVTRKVGNERLKVLALVSGPLADWRMGGCPPPPPPLPQCRSPVSLSLGSAKQPEVPEPTRGQTAGGGLTRELHQKGDQGKSKTQANSRRVQRLGESSTTWEGGGA